LTHGSTPSSVAERTRISSEEEPGGGVPLGQAPSIVAWSGRDRRGGRRRLFPGGATGVGPSGSGGSCHLLASGWYRHTRADRAWTGCAITGDYWRSSRINGIGSADRQEPLVGIHFRFSEPWRNTPHGLAGPALVYWRIQAGGRATCPRIPSSECDCGGHEWS